MPTAPWNPESWKSKVQLQAIRYPNPESLASVTQYLSRQAGFVFESEIQLLKDQLKQVESGSAFLFQAGDCTELFDQAHPDYWRPQIRLLQDLSGYLEKELHQRVILVARIAGLYAKPRTSAQEKKNQLILPSYQGDGINGIEFNLESRQAQAHLMSKAYRCSQECFDLIHLAGPLYTSREAFNLHYESALTRKGEAWYQASTHLPWIGMRTAKPNTAHVEYMRGISNPIGIKIGPDMETGDLIDLIRVLNPSQESGKIILIHRLGEAQIELKLPPLIQSVQKENLKVSWCCDPMHGNTFYTDQKIKTRSLKHMSSEWEKALWIHRRLGSCLGGIHLELTHQMVRECTQDESVQEDLSPYLSPVDPRLNPQQSFQLLKLCTPKLSN